MLVSFNNSVIMQGMDGEPLLWWILSTILVIIVSKGVFSKNEKKDSKEIEKTQPPVVVIIEKEKSKGIGWFIELVISLVATVIFGLVASGKQDLIIPLIDLLISLFTRGK